MKPHIRKRRGGGEAVWRVRLPDGILWDGEDCGPSVQLCSGPCFFCVCRHLRHTRDIGAIPS